MVRAMLQYTLENSGDVIPLENVTAKSFTKGIGRQGFGIAPTTVNYIRGAAAGRRFRNSRREGRSIVLPVFISGADAQVVEDSFRRLARLMQDDVTQPRIYAAYPNGDRYWTAFSYESGGDPQYGTDTNGKTFVRLGMTLQTGDPYWTSEDAVPYRIGPANQGRGLIGGSAATPGQKSLSQMKLSSSQTIGSVTIENPGDVPVKALWRITGPTDSNGLIATRADGQRFQYAAAVAAGQTIVIDTVNGLVYDAASAPDPNTNNLYGNMGPAPQLFALPPGSTRASVVMTGTSGSSLVEILFNPKRELVFG